MIWIKPLSSIYFSFLSLKSCWMSWKGPNISPSWIFVEAIIKFEWSKRISIKLLFKLTVWVLCDAIQLTNAPATFQQLMNSIFSKYLRQSVLVFFLYILVYSPDWGTHLTHLENVFKILLSNQLFLKEGKCLFGQQSVKYLGQLEWIREKSLLLSIGQFPLL